MWGVLTLAVSESLRSSSSDWVSGATLRFLRAAASAPLTLHFMVESVIAERIAARRAELDELEEQLVKQLDQVRDERDELAVAERVWRRMAERFAA